MLMTTPIESWYHQRGHKLQQMYWIQIQEIFDWFPATTRFPSETNKLWGNIKYL